MKSYNNSTGRKLVTLADTIKVMEDLDQSYGENINRKGWHGFASRHEILGILIGEMKEFSDEVHRGNINELLYGELRDIALAAVHGMASIKSGTLDW